MTTPRLATSAFAAIAALCIIGVLGTRESRARRGFAVPPARADDLFAPDGGPVAPGPVPRGLAGVAPADCASCHVDIAAEWASSGHARAWTDPIFQAEYRLAPSPFCRHCHAPLTPDDGAPAARATAAGADPTLAARGIDCAVCHVREGRVLGGHGRGEADHAGRRSARLATSAFCGSCHQFAFPRPRAGEPARYHPGQPLQNTLVEWAQSRYADRACQVCHMPSVAVPGARPHRSHAFRTFEDRELMARAVVVTASARRGRDELRVTVSIAAGEIGHGFPTGDMFREAVLTVRAGAAQRRQVLRRYFAPVITADGRGHLLGEVDDTRLAPAGPALALELAFPLDEHGGAAATEVSWSLDLVRLDPDDAHDRGLDPAAIVVPVQRGRAQIAGTR